MDKTVIVEKIAQDAESRVKSLLAEAEREVAATLDGARAEIETRRAAALTQARKEAETRILNRLALAELDIRREELKARQAEIGKAYAAVRHNLLILSGEGYKDLARKMLLTYAEDGDTVVAGASDIKKMDKAFIDSVAKTKKINLTLAPEAGAFDGGFKLTNAVCDKNLTFDGLLAELRSETEAEVVRLLTEK
ncbi:hypothetical protein FACS1894211_13740 [Clostridia bacterium]|nr:hypothetical protein FACS1894211_13740 [Clostridia bacterium]